MPQDLVTSLAPVNRAKRAEAIALRKTERGKGLVVPVRSGSLKTLANTTILMKGPEEPNTALPLDVTVDSDTFHSIGIFVALGASEDADYAGSVTVKYRKQGDATWSNAADLLRHDYDWWWNVANPYSGIPHTPTHNCFAGSICFLTPGTTYEVDLLYSHPLGTYPDRSATIETATRAIPVLPTGGSDIYVDNSVGAGGDGTSGNPYNSIQTANNNASAGDRVKIRTGSGAYDEATLNASGTEGNYIVYEPDTGHSPVIDSLRVTGDHIWIRGLTFEWDGVGSTFNDTSGIYVPSSSTAPDDIVITDNHFDGYAPGGGITSIYPLSRWIIVDNTCVGTQTATAWESGFASTSDEWFCRVGGEDNPGGPGCIIAYNTVWQTSEGVNFGYRDGSSNCDCFGNKIYHNIGNAISCDHTRENNRVWGNNVVNSAGNPLTFQPQRAGPWYFMYNHVVDHVFLNQIKWRVQDRIVFINNTFAGRQVSHLKGHNIMRSFVRNNLWLKESATLWNSVNDFDTAPNLNRDPLYTANWMTDIDYDGVDVGGAGNVILRWNDNATNYTTFASIYSNIGIWQNAKHVDADLIFTNKTYDESVELTLAAGTNAAVEAGQEVANLADFYSGSAPDLGCHDRGNGNPHYGQRTTELSLPLDQRTWEWSKH